MGDLISRPAAQPDTHDTNGGDATHKNVIYSPVQMAMDYAVNATDFSASSDTISRQAAIDAYIMKCPYFAGKNTINRSNIGTHIGSCDLEHHYRKVCPSNECICAERLGLKNE